MNDFNAVPFSQLSSNQAADMIKVAAQKPQERCMGIKEWRRKLDYSSLPKLKAWGLEVNTNMMKVNARILPEPQVSYARGKKARCMNG